MHICKICSKEYPYLSVLKNHIISAHKPKEARKLFCDKCDFSTPVKNTLLHHKRRKHNPEKQIQCPHCDYKNSVKASLQIHIDRYHKDVGGEAMHVCDVCFAIFIFENSMKHHKRHHHKIKNCSKFIGDKSHHGSVFKKQDQRSALVNESGPSGRKYDILNRVVEKNRDNSKDKKSCSSKQYHSKEQILSSSESEGPSPPTSGQKSRSSGHKLATKGAWNKNHNNGVSQSEKPATPSPTWTPSLASNSYSGAAQWKVPMTSTLKPGAKHAAHEMSHTGFTPDQKKPSHPGKNLSNKDRNVISAHAKLIAEKVALPNFQSMTSNSGLMQWL